MLPAYGVRCSADAYAVPAIVVLELVPVHQAVHKGNAVKNDMVVQMSLVQMGGDNDLVGLVRRDLSGGKGLDDMVAFPLAPHLAPAPFGVHHVGIDRIPVTVDGCFKTGALGLVPVEGIVDSGLQRGFFLVLGIVHALVQTVMHHKDFCVRH